MQLCHYFYSFNVLIEKDVCVVVVRHKSMRKELKLKRVKVFPILIEANCIDQSTPSTVDRESMWDLNPFPDNAVLSGHIYTATHCSWAVLHLVAPSLYCTCSRNPDNSV